MAPKGMKKHITFGTVAMFGMVLLLAVAAAPTLRDRIGAERCGKRLVVIHEAAQTWAKAHDGQLPSDFAQISTELGSPRLLICPGDESRYAASDWRSWAAVNSSYDIAAPAVYAKDMPPEVRQFLQSTFYLACRVHRSGVDLMGNVIVARPPMPPGVVLLTCLAVLLYVARGLWRLQKSTPGEAQDHSLAGDLLQRKDQAREDYLAARGPAPTPWYRLGLLAAARRALQALDFFRHRKSDPQAHETRA